eukprot:gene8223-1472_t
MEKGPAARGFRHRNAVRRSVADVDIDVSGSDAVATKAEVAGEGDDIDNGVTLHFEELHGAIDDAGLYAEPPARQLPTSPTPDPAEVLHCLCACPTAPTSFSATRPLVQQYQHRMHGTAQWNDYEQDQNITIVDAVAVTAARRGTGGSVKLKGTPFEVRFGDLAENYGAGHLPDATPSRATSAAAAAASATSSPPSSADAAASMLNRLNRQMVQVKLGTRMSDRPND